MWPISDRGFWNKDRSQTRMHIISLSCLRFMEGQAVIFSVIIFYKLFDIRVNLAGDDSSYIFRGYLFYSKGIYPTWQGPLYPIFLSVITQHQCMRTNHERTTVTWPTCWSSRVWRRRWERGDSSWAAEPTWWERGSCLTLPSHVHSLVTVTTSVNTESQTAGILCGSTQHILCLVFHSTLYLISITLCLHNERHSIRDRYGTYRTIIQLLLGI